MKILKNKITQVVTEFQDNEFPADFENWIEASASEITENKKQKLKKKLIASRQDFLSRTRDEAFRDMERGINTSLREKRLMVYKEIEEIQSENTLSSLRQFNINYDS